MGVNLKEYRIDKMVTDFVGKLNEEYKDASIFEVKFGKKYAKIVRRGITKGGVTYGGSAWGFIVMEDTKPTRQHPPYKMGDLLKSASWSAPARWARGNILSGSAKYQEYGPVYLK